VNVKKKAWLKTETNYLPNIHIAEKWKNKEERLSRIAGRKPGRATPGHRQSEDRTGGRAGARRAAVPHRTRAHASLPHSAAASHQCVQKIFCEIHTILKAALQLAACRKGLTAVEWDAGAARCGHLPCAAALPAAKLEDRMAAGLSTAASCMPRRSDGAGAGVSSGAASRAADHLSFAAAAASGEKLSMGGWAASGRNPSATRAKTPLGGAQA